MNDDLSILSIFHVVWEQKLVEHFKRMCSVSFSDEFLQLQGIKYGHKHGLLGESPYKIRLVTWSSTWTKNGLWHKLCNLEKYEQRSTQIDLQSLAKPNAGGLFVLSKD